MACNPSNTKKKKDVTCCGSTTTETTTKVTKTGGAMCEMPTGAVQYVGARYVPVFADPVTWTPDRPYEHLMMVQYQGNTYISKKAVPVGIDLPVIDEENNYWILFSKFDAQIETYREEVARIAEQQDVNERAIKTNAANIVTNTEDIAKIPHQISDAIEDLKIKMRGNQALITDWEIFVSLPDANGASLQSMALAEDGTLYACYHGDGNNSFIRRFPYFEDLTPGSKPTKYTELAITNNHCNSASIAGNYLYVCSWQSNIINVINLQTFQEETQITNWASQLRNAAFSEKAAWIQRYNSSQLDVVFLSQEDRFNMGKALGFKKPITTQKEWVQDCDVDGFAYMRVLSASGADRTTQSYIEIYNAWYDDGPIIVPFGMNRAELEGLAIGAKYDYVSYGSPGTIVRSKQLHTIRPQVGYSVNTNADVWFNMSSQYALRNNLQSGYVNRGLDYESSINSQNDLEYTITIPQSLYQAMRGATGSENPLLAVKCSGIGATQSTGRLGGLLAIPISGCETGKKRNAVMFGNTESGWWMLNIIVILTAGSNKTDAKLAIRFVKYQEFQANANNLLEQVVNIQNTGTENLYVDGLEFRLVR